MLLSQTFVVLTVHRTESMMVHTRMLVDVLTNKFISIQITTHPIPLSIESPNTGILILMATFNGLTILGTALAKKLQIKEF
jgi:hypothetical protein